MQRKGTTINFSNSCCDTKQKQNRYIHLNIKHIYRFKKAHLIQGSYFKTWLAIFKSPPSLSAKNKLTNEAENCLVNSSTATLNRAFAPVLEVFTFILCVTSEASDLNILKKLLNSSLLQNRDLEQRYS